MSNDVEKNECEWLGATPGAPPVSDNDKRILSDEEWSRAVASVHRNDAFGRSAADALLAHEAARREREAADTALLRKVEWTNGKGYAIWRQCPACDGHRPTEGVIWGQNTLVGHAPGCALRARIGGG